MSKTEHSGSGDDTLAAIKKSVQAACRSRRNEELLGFVVIAPILLLFLNFAIGKSSGTCVEDVDSGQVYRIIKMTDFGWNYSVQEWMDGWGKKEKMFKFKQNLVETRCP